MSLAPWKYRKVFKRFGGPIEDIALRKVAKVDTLLEQSHFEAVAYLQPKYVPEWKPRFYIYGQADGTGTGYTEIEAIHRAISEAIERWAFYSISRSNLADRFGFHLDGGTAGMAAFPGFFRSSARKSALREAIERWSILAWWFGLLPAEVGSFSQSIVLRPLKNVTTVILSVPLGAYEVHAYGFAAGATMREAEFRARVELDRNCRLIDSYFSKGGDSVRPTEGMALLERRLLWFAAGEGRAVFDEKVRSSLKLPRKCASPNLIVDTNIPGPWEKYATVWRCLAGPLPVSGALDSPEVFMF